MARTPKNAKPAPPSAAASGPPPRIARGPLAVGAVTDKLTRPLLGPRGLAEGDLVARWEAIVGPALAAVAVPERVRFPKGRRDGGELTVRVAGGPAALHLQYQIPRVLERINGFYGYRAVEKLKMVQGPLPLRRPPPPPPPPPLSAGEEQDLAIQLAAVTDPDLRAVLERLGRAVRQGNKKR